MRNFLVSGDFSRKEIEKVFSIADNMSAGRGPRKLSGHPVVALYFEKPSTRTRLSFETAAAELGGSSVYMTPDSTHAKRGESLSDMAKVMSLYADFIVARLFAQADLEEMARSSMVPVINALTDLEHPTQALADVYTIRSHLGSLSKARISFIGDIAANTANSLMVTAAKMGALVTLVGPKSCRPDSGILSEARAHSDVRVTDSVKEGLAGANVVYTDTFVSMGQESEAKRRERLFAPYQLNPKALSFAARGALVMHCLPAHRGVEITSDVLDGPSSVVWEQAGNKLLLNKALLAYLSRQ